MDRERRDVLQLIIIALTAMLPLAGRKIEPPKPDRHLMNVFSVAGLPYYSYQRLSGKLAKGDRLILRAEPRNPHDEFAVAIFRGRSKLGYVPRSDNRHMSRLLLSDVTLHCEVVEHDPGTYVSNAVKAGVWLCV